MPFAETADTAEPAAAFDPGLAAQIDSLPARLRAAGRRVLAASDFVAEALRRDAQLLDDLQRAGALEGARGPSGRACWPHSLPAPAQADEATLQRWLRQWRCREMVRIAWRDLSGLASLGDTLEDLTAFADDAVALAQREAWRLNTARFGTPRDAEGAEVPFVVLGMGKLGGRELNFSSDIDLVFLFAEYGETDHASPVSHDEFFIRLGQTLIRLLAAPTVDGFVFRVDMRLRPFGDSGPLACGFSAFEDYLAQHGRDWERYAYVKARALTGGEAYARLFANAVRPFVYRRYLDFGVFESLREMKQLIEKQVARRDMADHIKLGPGGIREIEFIVQAFQLLRGGQDRRLQTPRFFEALAFLGSARLLPTETVAELEAAYRYLRVLENRLQMLRDEQTHQLPADAASRQRLADAMGCGNWTQLVAILDGHRSSVQRHFNAQVFRAGGDEAEEAADAPRPPGADGAALSAARLWDEAATPEELTADFLARGCAGADAAAAARLWIDFRSGALVRRLDTTSLKRLQRLVPQLLTDLLTSDDMLVMLRRFLRVLEAIGPRSTYFALLNENPAARQRFVEACRGGEFLSAQIAAHPLLLDELLDERVFAEPPSRRELAADLADRLARVDAEDPERLVEALCQFKRAAVFRVAIADLSGRIAVMRVSDRLTDIAELILEQAMAQAWAQITSLFGVPRCVDAIGTAPRVVEVCAIGYGKLGGWELGYASDLDLVFLHDSAGESQETLSERPIDNQIFFVRLAQRIVHLLTMHSAAGRLYEVDVRLRPSGKGGMLITSIDAFVEYQRREAWTWEHQALLHARAVAGSAELRQRFEDARTTALREYVRRDSLREDVRSMRERMRRELSRAKPGEFDLKQDPGGIADIEFLAQYWALLWSGQYAAVAMFADTIRQLETLASGALVSQLTVDVLTGAYRAYRNRGHRRSLRDERPVVGDDEFRDEREAVRRIWDQTFTADASAAV